MHFDTSISDRDVDAAIMRSLMIGTPAAWDRSVANFSDEARHNPFASFYFAERYALELAMESVRKHKKVTERVPDVLKADINTQRLFAFAAMLAKVHDRLSPQAQKRLAGRVRGGLGDDIGLSPLAFEFLIAADFMRKGAEIDWHDLETGGGFDLLVRRGTAEMEVECKTFSADIGRKIHQRRHYQLGGLIYREISSAVRRCGNLFVDVLIEGHLSGNILNSVAASIRQALNSEPSISEGGPCSVTLHHLSENECHIDRTKRTLTQMP